MRIEGAAIAGSGMVRFGQYPDRSPVDLAREAGLAALHDAGMTLADVDEAFVGYIQPVDARGVKAMKELGLTGLPRHPRRERVGHRPGGAPGGGVGGGVRPGRVAMAIAFDKMTEMAGRRPSSDRGTGRDELDSTILPAAYFALWAQRRMHDHGTTPERLRRHRRQELEPRRALPAGATASPTTSVTVDEVLASRMVAEPLTAMMVCPADDGAAVRDRGRGGRASGARQPGRRIVRPVASALRSETYAPGHTFLGPVVGPATMTRDTALAAYEDAGWGPEDVDLALCHDAFANEELRVLRAARLLPGGRGRAAGGGAGHRRSAGRSRSTPTAGCIARGHPGGPTGLAMVHEIVQQLRGEAGPRQVDGARSGRSPTSSAAAACARSTCSRAD